MNITKTVGSRLNARLVIVAMILAAATALGLYATLGRSAATGEVGGPAAVVDQPAREGPVAGDAGSAGGADCASGRRMLGGGVPEGPGARPAGCRDDVGPGTDVHDLVGRGTGLLE